MELPIKKYLKIFLVLAVFSVLIGLPSGNVFAELGDYVPLAPLRGIGQTEANDLPAYLKAMFKLLLGVAGALAVIMITLGGIEYMSTDSMFGKEEGKQKINNALLGLFLAIGAWLILFTVNPKLLEFNFNPGAIPPINPPLASETGVWYKLVTCGNEHAGANGTTTLFIRNVLGEYRYTVGDPQDSRRAADECRNTNPRVLDKMITTPECSAGWEARCYPTNQI